MVEIAFSLAIVAFALVAIMGVLPTGMTVQKDNREDTVINQDAAYWLEALRSGSRGIDDLTNYVESITISNGITHQVNTLLNTFGLNSQIVSGEQIIGLLSTPKYPTNDLDRYIPGAGPTNYVVARVRAINGPATEKAKPTNEFAFRYQLVSEVIAGAKSMNATLQGELTTDIQNLNTNLHNLRVTLMWPLYQQGTNWVTGPTPSRRTAGALMNGTMYEQANNKYGLTPIYFLQPNNYTFIGNTNVGP